MSNNIDSQTATISSNENTISELKKNINAQKERTNTEVTATLERNQRDFYDKIKVLTLENSKLNLLVEMHKKEKLSLENDVLRINETLANLKLKHNTEQSNMEAHYRESLQKSIEDTEEEQRKIETEKLHLERELSEAKTQIISLKEQIRPIGQVLVK